MQPFRIKVTKTSKPQLYILKEMCKFIHHNVAFHLVACCRNFQDGVREDRRKTVNVTKRDGSKTLKHNCI